MPQYVRCMAAVSAGLLRARAAGVDLTNWRSVITHMSARLGELGDWATEAKARGIELALPEIRDGEEAVLKRAYSLRQGDRPPVEDAAVLDARREGRAHRQDREPPHPGLRRQRHGLHLPAGLHRRADAGRRTSSSRSIPKAIDREPNKASVEKLLKLPSFRQAYEFDGMTPDEFAQFGSFQATATEFAAATRQTVDFVRMTLEA